jgi:CHASE2 domain-containing sensor protein
MPRSTEANPLSKPTPSRRHTLGAIFLPAFLLSCSLASGADFNTAFALVMIDDATEQTLGPFPYDRSLYARAIEACARLKARAVVLKFFLDEPKSVAGDAALAAAMKKIPVFLQARLESGSGTPQPLLARFRYAGGGRTATAVRGDRGWIPLPQLQENAAGVGLLDLVCC